VIHTKQNFFHISRAEFGCEKKEIVGTLLMPIFFNKAEETEVRLAALTLLFVSNPP
jgi:hypothetical protein